MDRISGLFGRRSRYKGVRIMDLTPLLRSASEKEFEEVLEEVLPYQRILFKICREGGCNLIMSEPVPEGIIWETE